MDDDRLVDAVKEYCSGVTFRISPVPLSVQVADFSRDSTQRRMVQSIDVRCTAARIANEVNWDGLELEMKSAGGLTFKLLMPREYLTPSA